jgi:hypothetical protein
MSHRDQLTADRQDERLHRALRLAQEPHLSSGDAAGIGDPLWRSGGCRPAEREVLIEEPGALVVGRVTGADVTRAIGRSPQRGRALLAEVDLPAGNGVHH